MNADIRSGLEDGGRDHKSRDVYAILFLKGCGVPMNTQRGEAMGTTCPFKDVFVSIRSLMLFAKAGAPINPSCSASKTFL